MTNQFSLCIYDRLLKKKESRSGFTLIELLVAIGLIIVLGTTVVSVIVATLRGSSKETVATDVKQNGDYALSQMTRTIRSSVAIQINSSTQIIVTLPDNSQVTYDCSGNTINFNGKPLLDSSVLLVKNSCSFTNTQQSSVGYPIVEVQFSLKQSNSSSFAENTATVPFQTSVVVRNQ